MFGVTLLQNWKYALIIGLLLTIALGRWYYTEQLEDKQQAIDNLEVKVIKLDSAIDRQNMKIEEWREKNKEAKQKIEEKQAEVSKIHNEMETRIDELKNNRLQEDASCNESMNWMREKANKELNDE